MSLGDSAPPSADSARWPGRLAAPAQLWAVPSDEDGALWVGIDTATRLGGVALWRNGQVLAERTWHGGLNHTAQVVPALINLLAAVGLRQDTATPLLPDHGGAALAGVVASTGPGSFTGLRVGLACAKALAVARGVPLVGVPGLDALAYQLAAVGGVRRGTEVCAVSDAGRGNVYAARYRMRSEELWRVSRYAVLSPDELVAQLGAADVRMLVGGELSLKTARDLTADFAERITVVPPAAALRRPGYLVALGKERTAAAGDPAILEPLYIRRSSPEAARLDAVPPPRQRSAAAGARKRL